MIALVFLFACVSASMISLPITKRYNTLNGVQKRGLHQATLFNDQGSEYLITIGIGTPIQNFTLSLDTGSADLWVPSIECPTEQCPLARFNASESSSFQRINSSLFHVQYGIGSVNGTYGRDEIYLGEAHVSQQQFGLASSTHDLIVVTSEKTNEISNGIFGLGHPSLTTSKEKYEPFLYQLAKQGKIDQAMFSISMGARHHDGWSGEMLIGGINNDKHVGEIQYAAVMENSTYWMVGGQSIQLIEEDKVTMNETFDGVRGMIIDTGTTLTYVDHPLADRIVQSVVGGQNNVALDQMSGTYIVNCQAENLSKDNQVHILLENDIVLEIPVKDLIIPLDGKTIQEATQCMFGIAPWMTTGTSAKMNEKGWILIGDSVLRSTYLVFDMKKNQIGFAKAAHLQEMMQSYANSLSPPSLAFFLFSVITLTLT